MLGPFRHCEKLCTFLRDWLVLSLKKWTTLCFPMEVGTNVA